MLETTVWIFFKLYGCIALLNVGCESLKDMRVSVPSAIRKGETAVFLCDFDLEDDQLYTVKWYKGRKEFFRYTPKDEFPVKTFPVDHVNVDKNKSNMTQLTLLAVSAPLTGIYNCEVSAESPSFHTILASGEMTVVEPPAQDPTIHGVKQRYRLAEQLEAMCVADGSRPAANISWFINDEKAHWDLVQPFQPIIGSGDLIKSRSLLSFTVKSHSFRNGMLVIRCKTNILNLYQRFSEHRIQEASMNDQKFVVVLSDSEVEISRGVSCSIHVTVMIFLAFLIIVQ